MNIRFFGGAISEKKFGVMNDDGKTIYFWGLWNCVECYKWQSETDMKFLADDRDPAFEPPCQYKIEPENQGILVWLSGTPGCGKSTTGLLMSQEAGYVYFEGDSAENHLNPFLPENVIDNPTKYAFRQKPLKVNYYGCYCNILFLVCLYRGAPWQAALQVLIEGRGIGQPPIQWSILL